MLWWPRSYTPSRVSGRVARARRRCRGEPREFLRPLRPVAIILPGPIVGQMVHPYRIAGPPGAVQYDHPALEPILADAGVPLFQEQLLRMAMVAGRLHPAARPRICRRGDGLHQANPRSDEADFEVQLRDGMTKTGSTVGRGRSHRHLDRSFALYGFPRSHAASSRCCSLYASAYSSCTTRGVLYPRCSTTPMASSHPSTLVGRASAAASRFHPIDVRSRTVLHGLARLPIRRRPCATSPVCATAGRADL